MCSHYFLNCRTKRVAFVRENTKSLFVFVFLSDKLRLKNITKLQVLGFIACVLSYQEMGFAVPASNYISHHPLLLPLARQHPEISGLWRQDVRLPWVHDSLVQTVCHSSHRCWLWFIWLDWLTPPPLFSEGILNSPSSHLLHYLKHHLWLRRGGVI